MDIYVDATTLIALGQAGELDLLTVFDGDVSVPNVVLSEITTEPTVTSLERLCSSSAVRVIDYPENGNTYVFDAQRLLDEDQLIGDVQLIALVLMKTNLSQPVAVVSNDRRVRTVARGLGATVTGTIGVVVRNVSDGQLTADEAKELVRRLDSHGLHMTGELRETADELIDDAAEEREE